MGWPLKLLTTIGPCTPGAQFCRCFVPGMTKVEPGFWPGKPKSMMYWMGRIAEVVDLEV